MDVDSRALKVLTDWSNREYKSEGQKANKNPLKSTGWVPHSRSIRNILEANGLES